MSLVKTHGLSVLLKGLPEFLDILGTHPCNELLYGFGAGGVRLVARRVSGGTGAVGDLVLLPIVSVCLVGVFLLRLVAKCCKWIVVLQDFWVVTQV